jgi:hypothetical protein
MLRIEADRTTLGAATLLVGWRTISRDYFRNDPPSPLDLENAIDHLGIDRVIIRAS